MPEREIALRITNSLTRDLTVHLEPWGEEYRLAASASLKVEAKGPDNDILELDTMRAALQFMVGLVLW